MLALFLASAALAPATFAPGIGWHVGAGRVHACPGVKAASCQSVSSYAATVRWRDCASCLPHKTVAALPAGGVALQLLLSRERRRPKWMRPLRWPPRIVGANGPFEGLPTRIGVFQTIGIVHGYTAYLFVFFGRPSPSRAQLNLAHAELTTVSFPPRP
jgi:hypothetical protein